MSSSIIKNPLVLKTSVDRNEVTMDASVSLIRSLTASGNLIGLEILSVNGRFEFRIIIPKNMRQLAEDAVYSVFPHADFTEGRPLSALAQNYWLDPVGVCFEDDQSLFWAPVLTADKIRNVDPLGILLQSMSRLKENQFAALQLLVRKEQYPWHREAEKNIHKGLFTAKRLKSWATAAKTFPGLILMDLGKPEKEPRFEPDIHNAFLEKLRQPFLEVMGNFVFGIPDKKDRDLRIQSIKAALDHYSVNLGSFCLINTENINTEKLIDFTDNFSFNLNEPDWKSGLPNDWRLMLLTASELAALWHLPTAHIQTPGLQTIPTVAPEIYQSAGKQDGIILGIHDYQGQNEPVFLSNIDRQEHMMIIGKTGSGKSTFMHHLIRQDILAGRGVAVIDPHGPLVTDILEQSIPQGREKDVVVFDIADREFPVGLGFFNVPPNATPDQKEKVVTHIVGVFKRIFADSWSPTRMENALTATIATLIETPGTTLMDINRLFTDEQFRYKAISRVKDPGTLEFWYSEFDRISEKERRDMLRPILNRIRRFYGLPTIRNITCQTKNLNIYDIINSGKIFLASMDNAGAESEENNLGALLVSQFQIAVMSRLKDKDVKIAPYYLYVDEVQNFITTSLETVFSEARKYGLSITIANQYLEQLRGSTLGAVMGNVGAMAIFICGARDASTLENEVKPAFKAEDIAELNPHEAIIKMRVQKRQIPAFKIKTFPPVEKRSRERAQMLRELSRTIYATERQEIEEQLKTQVQPTDITNFEEPANE